MNNPWYLIPFVVVYKIVFFLLLLPFNLIKLVIKVSVDFYKYIFLNFLRGIYVWFYVIFVRIFYRSLKGFLSYFWKGTLFIAYMIRNFCRYFFIGISAIYTALYSFLYRMSLSIDLEMQKRNELAREKRREKQLASQKRKEELERKKQKEFIEKKEKQKEKENKKKKQNDEYKNENVVIEKQTFGKKVKKFFYSIFHFPTTFKNFIIRKYQNSVFVKNARNKRDMKRQALLIDFEGEDAVKSDKKVLYQYIAKNAQGKVVKDYFEAFSKVEVHSFLLSEGYEVYSIKSSPWIRFLHGNASVNKTKIKTKDLIFFVTQLSTYIKAGIPLAEALKILSRQYKKKSYKKIFSAIIYDLTMGESFSSSLEKQGNAFPRLLINMIKTAEMTGELPEALDDMSNYYSETLKTKRQMITALMYPTMVFIFAIAVIIFILVWVIPQFIEIYESMDASKIPKFTLFVISISAFLKKYLIWLLLGVILFVFIVVYLYKKVKAIRTVMQYIMMHIPVMGNVIIYNEVTMFTKTFASLLKHNVFITDSMEILNKITNNEIYKMLILDTITNIAHGDKISMSFKDHWAFPIPAYEMLVTGEKTGQLPDMMAKVSDYYQDLHAQAVARIKTFIEPILIIFLTVMVGIIILAIILPMFGMYEMIQ